MEDKVKDTIKRLVEAYGPSGHEEQVRELIRTEIADWADEISLGRLGNVVALRRGTPGDAPATRIMLVAHMDEIGVMVTHVDDEGFLRFVPIGGLSLATLVGGRVMFGDGTVGVIGVERRARSQLPKLEQLYIDVGAKDKASCPIEVGDAAVFKRGLEDLGDQLVAKAMDDRLGCAVLIETMRRLNGSPHDVYFVFSTQEETTQAGAQTTAYQVAPDVALAVDVTDVGDTPQALKVATKLGAGPAIKVRDGGMIAHRRVKDWMIQCAEEKRLPHQREVLLTGSTDARLVQTTREGVPAGALSIPCRYVHTVSEMVDYADVQNSVELLLALLARPIDF
jgi:putative aminopeptidase FrvX